MPIFHSSTISDYNLLNFGEVGLDGLDREGMQWPQHERGAMEVVVVVVAMVENRWGA